MAARGYCLIELVFVSSLSVVLAAIAIPQFLVSLADHRAAGAARYVATHCARARMEAIQSGRDVAVRFTEDEEGVAYAIYADGNGDGVRTRDIQRGIDRQLLRPERLTATFPGVAFAVPAGLPAVDTGSPTDGDPLKLGSGNLLSYSALGTSSSGSIYIRGRNGTQYVIRVYGETGKTRLLKFNSASRHWDPL
jgi:hypothetical protein